MNITVQPNRHQATFDVHENGQDSSLVRLAVSEQANHALYPHPHTDFNLVLERDSWQTVVDKLAALGIVAAQVSA